MLALPFVVDFPVPRALSGHLKGRSFSKRATGCLTSHNHTIVVELALAPLRQYRNLGKETFMQVANELENTIGIPVGRNPGQRLLNLPGSDVLLRPLSSLGLSPALVAKVAADLSRKKWEISDPALISVVLMPLQGLTEDERAQLNAALRPFGLWLNMRVSDIWVQKSAHLTPTQLDFLLSTVEHGDTYSPDLVGWAKRHCASDGRNAMLLKVWARVRLSRNHPHRAEIDKVLRTIGLTVDSDIPYEDLE